MATRLAAQGGIEEVLDEVDDDTVNVAVDAVF